MNLLVEDQLPRGVSEREACNVLDICRNSLRAARARYHFFGPISPYRRKRRKARQPRALSEEERMQATDILTSTEYQDQPPAQVYYSLLQQGVYLCSISTMHRLLRDKALSGERRQQRPPSPQPIPRLQATAPNQVWAWDIAKLATCKRGEYLSLYVVMDLFSRHIVAWMLSRKENSALSSQLITEACDRYRIQPDSLTLHQDRGMPMTAHCYLDLLGELAITASHSRPRVSNDNPMSEAQFKTMKYQPDYPRCFDSYDHAMRWCEEYVHWYNICIITAVWPDLRHTRCSAVNTLRLPKSDRLRWMKCMTAIRSDLPKAVPSCGCRRKKFVSIPFRPTRTSKPLKKELTSRPCSGSSKKQFNF